MKAKIIANRQSKQWNKYLGRVFRIVGETAQNVQLLINGQVSYWNKSEVELRSKQ